MTGVTTQTSTTNPTAQAVGPVVVLCGGVGAAKFLSGLIRVMDPSEITAIVNVGDDSIMHGLHISPDLDTIVYTLSDSINPETGWGLRDETWNAMETLRMYAAANSIDQDDPATGEAAGWFALGDQDLGTHMYRTSRLASGSTLSTVTAEIAKARGIDIRILPVTDDPLRTVLTTGDGDELAFQEYFVREHHEVTIDTIRFDGAEQTRPAAGVVEAIEAAASIIIAPSNPLISIGPVLAVPGLVDAITKADAPVVAISPIVGGKALKGPADRLMEELGHESSAVGVARIYADLDPMMVIDDVDAKLVEELPDGTRSLVTNTIMKDPVTSAQLAADCLEFARS